MLQQFKRTKTLHMSMHENNLDKPAILTVRHM